MRSAKGIEGKSESFAKTLLDRVHLLAVFFDREARFMGSKFRRSTMLVGGANEQNLVSTSAMKSSAGISGQHGTDKIAEMLDPIDVGKGRGNEIAAHELSKRRVTNRGLLERRVALEIRNPKSEFRNNQQI